MLKKIKDKAKAAMGKVMGKAKAACPHPKMDVCKPKCPRNEPPKPGCCG